MSSQALEWQIYSVSIAHYNKGNLFAHDISSHLGYRLSIGHNCGGLDQSANWIVVLDTEKLNGGKWLFTEDKQTSS